MLEKLIQDLNKHNPDEVVYKSGVSRQTLNNIMKGRNTNPTIKTVAALQRFIDSKEQEK